MGALIGRVWARLKTEPVARNLSPVLLAAAAYLVWRDGGDPADIIAALVVALGGGTAVVAARAKVFPAVKLPQAVLDLIRQHAAGQRGED